MYYLILICFFHCFRSGVDPCLLFATFETMLSQLRSSGEINISSYSKHLSSRHDLGTHLDNYFNFHVCLSIRPSVPSVSSILCVQKLIPVYAVGSQNVTNRSFLLSVKSEKYAFWVTLRPLGFMR